MTKYKRITFEGVQIMQEIKVLFLECLELHMSSSWAKGYISFSIDPNQATEFKLEWRSGPPAVPVNVHCNGCLQRGDGEVTWETGGSSDSGRRHGPNTLSISWNFRWCGWPWNISFPSCMVQLWHTCSWQASRERHQIGIWASYSCCP